MKRLAEALEDLFAEFSRTGGRTSRTAGYAMENVTWSGETVHPERATNAVVENFLESACARSGPPNSITRRLADALLETAADLKWRTRPLETSADHEFTEFARNYTSTTVFGEGGLLPSKKTRGGFILQGPGRLYPAHAHTAEESYWVIGGHGEWKVGKDPWFPVEPGSAIYHGPEAVHAMRTSDQPLLNVWLWTSHLHSAVRMVAPSDS